MSNSIKNQDTSTYEVQNLHGNGTQIIRFYTGLYDEAGNKTGHIDGTTNEELIKVLKSRICALDAKLPCLENQEALRHLNKALVMLETRTKHRTTRNVIGTNKE